MIEHQRYFEDAEAFVQFFNEGDKLNQDYSSKSFIFLDILAEHVNKFKAPIEKMLNVR